jgi:uncharacterized protein (DUF302 family)
MKKILLAISLATFVSACLDPQLESQLQPQSDSPEAVTQNPTESNLSTEVLTTDLSFQTVETNLREALKKRNLKLFTVVNHGEGAKSVSLDIGQSKLFLFGNPKSGTPLMMENRSMGLELPLKVLIYTTNEGKVAIRHSDIQRLTQQYGVRDQEERVKKIEMTLKEISSDAIAQS